MDVIRWVDGWAFDSKNMKHITKPIQAIHFMALAFLMAIGIVFPTAARTGVLEVGNQYFCKGLQRTLVGGMDGNELKRLKQPDSLVQIKSGDKVLVHLNDGRRKEYDIITQEMLRLLEDPPFEIWESLIGEDTSYNTNWKGMRAARYWRITFDGEFLTEVQHGRSLAVVAISKCNKI